MAASGAPDLSIVIVNWNAKAHLRRCLESLRQTFPTHVSAKITVVDNASSDGTLAMLGHEFPEVEPLCNTANLGFARANNLAIRQSTSRYLCLLNSDVVVHEGCFDRLLVYLANHPEVGLVGPQLLNPDGTAQPSCYGFPTRWNTLCHALGIQRLLPRATIFNGLYGKYDSQNRQRQVDVLSGCFWVIRREVLQQVGLLDENFFIYWEDFDYCKRCQDRGWPIVYLPEAKATHYGGASSAAAPLKFIIETERAGLHYWRKHHGLLGALYIGTLIFVRHSLRLLLRSLHFVFLPASRTEIEKKIRQSLATLLWLGQGAPNRKVRPE